MRFISRLNSRGLWDVLDTKNLIICPFDYHSVEKSDKAARDFNDGSDYPTAYTWTNPDGTYVKFVD